MLIYVKDDVQGPGVVGSRCVGSGRGVIVDGIQSLEQSVRCGDSGADFVSGSGFW